MLRVPRTLLLSALLSCSAVVSADAQQVAVQPTPIEATHPQAQLARGFVDLALAGRTAEAESYLRTHGAPEWVAGPEMEAQLAEALERVSGGGYTVDGWIACAPTRWPSG